MVELLRSFDFIELTVLKNDELNLGQIDDYDKIILSPGPDLPEAAGQLMEVIQHFHFRKPILGICLGYQALGQFFGAKLCNFKEPFHGEQTMLSVLTACTLFQHTPVHFKVGLYHSWYISDEDFPEELNIVAMSAEGVIMAFEHKKLPIYGVQFHPESYMSDYGREIMSNFLIGIKK